MGPKRRIAPSTSEEESEEQDELASQDSESQELEDELDELEEASASPEVETAAPLTPASGIRIKFKISDNSGPASLAAETSSSARSSRRSVKLTDKAIQAKSETPSSLPTRRSKRKREGENDVGSSDSADDDEEEDGQSEGGSSMNLGKMTARQRARELGDDATDRLVSLPMNTKKKKVLTEAELALKKSEDNRKRRALVDKKLEDEKQETINRLLKKQGTRGKGAPKGSDETGTSTPQPVAIAAPPTIPTMYRYISSIKDGTYISSYSFPLNSTVQPSPSAPIQYPPVTRPPPPTRRLKV